MSRGSLTTTSYAVLGLLAIKPWTSYELTQQMERSLGRIWPRTVSKLYEQPKKLVDHGLARSASEPNGRRTRTIYTITAKGRRSLAAWLQEPGEGPVIEFEQLVKVFFAENGSTADTLNTLNAAQQWARARCAESLTVGEAYLSGEGPFPDRLPELQLASRFIADFYLLVLNWADWAASIVDAWPDDPRRARHEREVLADTVERARTATAGEA